MPKKQKSNREIGSEECFSSYQVHLSNKLQNILEICFTQKVRITFNCKDPEVHPKMQKLCKDVQSRLGHPVSLNPGDPSAAMPFGPYFSVSPEDENEKDSQEEKFCSVYRVTDEEENTVNEDRSNLLWSPVRLTESVAKSSNTKNKTKPRTLTSVLEDLQKILKKPEFSLPANDAQANLEASISEIGGSPSRCLLFWKMGAGKTIAAIRYAHLRKDRSVLVIASKTLVGQWARSLSSHLDSCCPCTNWTIMSYEKAVSLICLPHSRKKAQKDQTFNTEFWDLVVVDEAHFFKNITASKEFVIHQILRAQNLLFLSGTPVRNDASDLAFWALALAGRDLRAGAEKDQLAATCMRYIRSGQADSDFRNKIHFFDPQTSLPSSRLADHYPEVERTVVKTPVHFFQALEYVFMTSGLALEIRDGQMLSCVGPLRQWKRAAPLTAVAESKKPDGGGYFFSAKTSAVAELICKHHLDPSKKAGGTIVYSRFKQFFPMIQQEIQKKNPKISIKIMCGDTEMSRRNGIVDMMNKKKLDVLMLCRVGGEGVDLFGAENIHIFEPQMNQAETEQAVGRAVRYRKAMNEGSRTVRVFEHVSTLPETAEEPVPAEEMLEICRKIAPGPVGQIETSLGENRSSVDTCREICRVLSELMARDISVEEESFQKNLEKNSECQKINRWMEKISFHQGPCFHEGEENDSCLEKRVLMARKKNPSNPQHQQELVKILADNRHLQLLVEDIKKRYST